MNDIVVEAPSRLENAGTLLITNDRTLSGSGSLVNTGTLTKLSHGGTALALARAGMMQESCRPERGNQTAASRIHIPMINGQIGSAPCLQRRCQLAVDGVFARIVHQHPRVVQASRAD